MLAQRIVVLAGEVDNGTAHLIVAQLLHLAAQSPAQDINLHIKCSGVSVPGFLALYDTVQALACDVSTWCTGSAGLLAAAILAAGAPGKRHALAHARVVLGHARIPTGEGGAGIEAQAAEVARGRQAVEEILARHTGQPVERIAADCQQGLVLSAQEALDYGLADDILEPGSARFSGLQAP